MAPIRLRPIPLPTSFAKLSLLSAVLFFSLPAFVGLGAWYTGSRSYASPLQSMGYSRNVMRSENLRRANSPTEVCMRYSHQSALIGDTIYIYGGQVKESSSDKSNLWSNDFVTLSISDDWDTADPALAGLAVPDETNGPPKVANGYLWNDGKNLYLYGGLFSDNPDAEPTDFAIWKYDTSGKKWSDVTSDTSVDSSSGSKAIVRAAEGAGSTIPSRGLGYYFGGHLDSYTIAGWGKSTPRVYLKSLLQFDMTSMTFNNITDHGLESAGVPERADGVLVFVPWGEEGILLAIGGGTNETFSQMNVIDVYSVKSKQWTKQSTAGDAPKYRVNPCAVVASAADGSSHQIHFYGGQNLIPYGEQNQYDDMWILTIPAFTWIQVNATGGPPARAGHTCEITGSMMIVIGGYVDPNLSCDSPGYYVFDTSETKWVTSYSSDSASDDASDSGSATSYKVPQVVVDIVGGDGSGGATITSPAKGADQTDSPVATGKPGQYKYTTIAAYEPITSVTTDAAGNTITTITTPTAGSGSSSSEKVGPIVGGVVGGIVLLVVLLLGGAYAWYRRKIAELREQHRAQGALAAGKTPGDVNVDADGQPVMRRVNSTDDLENMQIEPSFWGVLLSPRRSLRVVNA